MQAVVLCAGAGKRCEPFTLTRPKTLIPLAGKPLLTHLLERLREAHMGPIVLVVPREHARIRSLLSGRKDVTLVVQSEPKGSADALLSAREVLEDEFLLLFGDVLLPPSFIAAVAEAGPLSAGLIPAEELNRRMGAHLVRGRIRGFTYRVRWEKELRATHALAGIFHLDKRILSFLETNPGYFQRVPPGVPQIYEYDLAQSLQEMIFRHTLRGVVLSDCWFDLDYPWELLLANRFLLGEMGEALKRSSIEPSARVLTEEYERLSVGAGSLIEETVRLRGPVLIGKNCIIKAGTHIYGPAVIGDDCEIGPQAWVADASLGSGVHLGHCAEFTGIMMDKCYSMHYSYVSGIIGENCNIGAGTLCGTLRHDDREISVEVNGSLEPTGLRGLGCFMGDNSRTGVGSMILPGRKMGPRSAIGPGVILTRTLPPERMLLLEQKLKESSW